MTTEKLIEIHKERSRDKEPSKLRKAKTEHVLDRRKRHDHTRKAERKLKKDPLKIASEEFSSRNSSAPSPRRKNARANKPKRDPTKAGSSSQLIDDGSEPSPASVKSLKR